MIKKLFTMILSLILTLIPLAVHADESESLPLEDKQKVETTSQMTQEKLDDLLGLDPYLGPTSWLDSKVSD